jgi:hypothetical protein
MMIPQVQLRDIALDLLGPPVHGIEMGSDGLNLATSIRTIVADFGIIVFNSDSNSIISGISIT